MTIRHWPSQFRRAGAVGGFTLIEVMISMALVLGLIIGINAVFKMAADTVGAGQALSSKMRDSRAAQTVFYNDLSHLAPPDSAPFLIIDSQTQAAFRDARDQENDRDGNPLTIDMDGDNQEGNPAIPGENISPAAANDRAHRIDILSFFARGDLYRRQTGNPGVYVSDMATQDAWITYGHGRVYDQTAVTAANEDQQDIHYLNPGAGTATTNPKNFYASDWVLQRVAMLMINPVDTDKDGLPDGIFENPASLTRQYFWAVPRSANPVPAYELRPLGRLTQATTDAGTAAVTPPDGITDARYDLVGMSMDSEMVYGFPGPPSFSVNGCQGLLKNYMTQLLSGTANYIPNWWDVIAGIAPPPSSNVQATVSGTNEANRPGRFRCNPYPTKPIDTRKAAQLSSIMLGNCTQFIVEYAGDFLRQDPVTGQLQPPPPGFPPVTATQPLDPDGTVDFYLEQGPNGQLIRRVRWYGFPRDTGGASNGGPDGKIFGWRTGRTPNDLLDVVPLRDVIRTAPALATSNGASFEKTIYRDSSNATIQAMPVRDDYAAAADVPHTTSPSTSAGVAIDNHYVCAWGPNDMTLPDGRRITPTMLRITFRIDDPNGRLAEGQTCSFIINLP